MPKVFLKTSSVIPGSGAGGHAALATVQNAISDEQFEFCSLDIIAATVCIVCYVRLLPHLFYKLIHQKFLLYFA